MILQRIAAGLVFAAGAAVLRLSVWLESWVLLGIGLAIVVGGFTWLVFGTSSNTAAKRDRVPIARESYAVSPEWGAE